MSLYDDRLNRVRAAMNFQAVDKIPFLSGGPAAMAAYEGVRLKDYCDDMELCCTTNIKFCQDFNVDGCQASIYSPHILPALWLSDVKAPGYNGLGDNELWQVEEAERMTQDDYDKILEEGFPKWQADFLQKFFPGETEKAQPYFDYLPTAEKRFKEEGIPSLVNAIFESPFEQLCGARSLITFLTEDIMDPDMEDTILDVFDHMHKLNMENYEKQCKSGNLLGVWVGGWRGTPSMLSPAMFEKYSWKYMRDYIDLCVQYHVIPICHLDSDWTLGMKYFNEFPKHSVIAALDGKTDMRKAREAVGDNVCLMGDVPAEMLAFSTPEKVYEYCMNLIKDVGPTGYIMCSGCDIPFNANFDCVRQMQRSVEDYGPAEPKKTE